MRNSAVPRAALHAAQRHEDQSTVVQLNWPWWLHPAVATVMLAGVTAVAAINFPEDVYATWGVRKYITGSFLVVNGELGSVGMGLYWLATGLIIGCLYVALRNGSLPASLTYAVFYIGILELPRFIYWTQGRSFPLLLAVLFISLGYPNKTSRRNPILKYLPPRAPTKQPSL